MGREPARERDQATGRGRGRPDGAALGETSSAWAIFMKRSGGHRRRKWVRIGGTRMIRTVETCLAAALLMISVAAGEAPTAPNPEAEARMPEVRSPAGPAPAPVPTVTGLVVSEQTGAPIPRARVELFEHV